jgi:hypothetical protein
VRTSSLLVLVRWQGDVIAAHTVEQGRNVQKLDFLDGCEGLSNDVRVEMYDVTPERGALGKLKPKADLRTAYAIAVSTVLHASVALAAVFTLVTQPTSQKLEADDANRLGATVQAETPQTAADQGAVAGAPEPPKEEKKAEPEPPEQAAEVPEPEEIKPIPEPAQEASSEPLGAPAQEEGSEAPGTGGEDSITATPATCSHLKVPKTHGKMCTRTVVLSSLDVAPSCFVDTIMKVGETGTLFYPCEGDGEVKLTFGRKSFGGASISGKLDMCAGTEYPFSDGCKWTSAQRVTGRLTGDHLTFSYGEAPKVGQQKKFCASACSATGVVRVK